MYRLVESIGRLPKRLASFKGNGLLNMNLPTEPDRPAVRVPPPLVFLVLLMIASVLEYRFGFEYPKGPFTLRASVALILFLFAGYSALHSVVVLKKGGTFVDPGRPTTQIVDAGPFHFSRNPMYLSLVLVLLALSILLFSIWFLFFAAVLWAVIDRIAVVPEEVYLEQKFGNRYREYKKRVRRWL
jgi:protein-S-isoprenylcysteine O-methyltransferase Ste14